MEKLKYLFERKESHRLEKVCESSLDSLNPEELIECKKISHELGNKVQEKLVYELKKSQKNCGYKGDTNLVAEDLKSDHQYDKDLNEIIYQYFEKKNINVLIEKQAPVIKENADFSVFVDPVDGSVNWDRQIGDPCFVIAISKKTENVSFNDLSFAYAKSLRSNEYYIVENKIAYYYNQFCGQTQMDCRKITRNLSQSSACLRYGYSLAVEQFRNTIPLLLKANDVRGIENSAFEECGVGRGVFDFMVEARGKSEDQNLLAYPIFKAAGALICDLNGQDFGNKIISSDGHQDFILCANQKLQDEILGIMSKFKKEKIYYIAGKTRIEMLD